MNTTILVVEDDIRLQKYLSELLAKNGYVIQSASDGLEAIELIEEIEPNLVLLDLTLPTMSGEAVCMEIRKNFPQLPVIVLTAKDSVQDIVKGLSLGADDYITKPFITDELLARIKARLRSQGRGEEQLKVDDLTLNVDTLEVFRGEKMISLTPQEFKLLHYLMANQGRVLTREMILSRIWATSPDIETRVVDVYIGYLRKKIDHGFTRPLIHSARGFGYVLKPGEEN